VKALRDVEPARFHAEAGGLDPVTRRRAQHVITENQRTIDAAEAMRRGDVGALGKRMNESHASLRDDYEVSSPALNAMVETALAHKACFGARMTGAGFGGCAMAIIDVEAADDFAKKTSAGYRAKTGHTPAVYVCQATNGAEAFATNGE
jgi:galactokinase